MLILVTYDVNTETSAGKRRLRQVAKACVAHGQRVQNSVFECSLDAAQYKLFQAQLTALIDPSVDSLRFYYLGNNPKHKVHELSKSPYAFRLLERLGTDPQVYYLSKREWVRREGDNYLENEKTGENKRQG